MAKIKGESLQNSVPDPGKEVDDPMNDYETKGHLNTLMDAHQIMNDPVKMAKVHKLAGRHKNAIKGIQDIKDHYNDTYGGKNAMNSLKGSVPQETGSEGE